MLTLENTSNRWLKVGDKESARVVGALIILVLVEL